MSDFTLEFAAEQVVDEASLILFIKLLLAKRRDDDGTNVEKIIDQMEANDGLFTWNNLVTQQFLAAFTAWSELTSPNNEHYQKPLKAIKSLETFCSLNFGRNIYIAREELKGFIR